MQSVFFPLVSCGLLQLRIQQNRIARVDKRSPPKTGRGLEETESLASTFSFSSGTLANFSLDITISYPQRHTCASLTLVAFRFILYLRWHHATLFPSTMHSAHSSWNLAFPMRTPSSCPLSIPTSLPGLLRLFYSSFSVQCVFLEISTAAERRQVDHAAVKRVSSTMNTFVKLVMFTCDHIADQTAIYLYTCIFASMNT